MVHVTAGHILWDWKRFGLSHRCESLRLWPVCTRSVWYWWGQDLQTYKIAPLVSFVVGFFPCSCYSCTSDRWMILASRQAGKLMFIDFFVISVALFCFQRTFWHCSPMTTWVAVTARAHDWTWRTIHRSDFTILLIKGLMHHTSRLFITCCCLVNFFVVTSLSIPHQQAAEWVSNQFQMCITNLRIVRDRKKDITGGGKRLILTPRGFEKKSALKSACAQSRDFAGRRACTGKNSPRMSRSCLGRVSVVSRSCLGRVLVLSWSCLGDVSVLFWWCLGHVSVVSRSCLCLFCWCLGVVLVLFLLFFWWCFGDLSVMCWWRLGHVSVKSPWCVVMVLWCLRWWVGDGLVLSRWCCSAVFIALVMMFWFSDEHWWTFRSGF